MEKTQGRESAKAESARQNVSPSRRGVLTRLTQAIKSAISEPQPEQGKRRAADHDSVFQPREF